MERERNFVWLQQKCYFNTFQSILKEKIAFDLQHQGYLNRTVEQGS